MNPLQKFYRQPKIYIQLPSKGNYYPEGSLIGDPNNVPIYAMTGMDELLMKTPDALFNGEASVKLIESCCPYITNGKIVPIIDIDTILAAIRIATFGDSVSINHTCSECKQFNEYDMSAQNIIDHYSTISYNNMLKIGDITIYFRPLMYDEMTSFNVDNFSLQKMLLQLSVIEDIQDRNKMMDEIYQKLAHVQTSIFIASIESVVLPDDTIVNDYQYITDWLANSDLEYYSAIKRHLEEIKKDWAMPKSSVKCNACGHEELTEVTLDQSHFFA